MSLTPKFCRAEGVGEILRLPVRTRLWRCRPLRVPSTPKKDRPEEDQLRFTDLTVCAPQLMDSPTPYRTVHRTVLYPSSAGAGLSSPIRPEKKRVAFATLFFSGVGDGTRTHNAWNHNPVLCQLNYTHHIKFAERMARQKGLEPLTYCLEG